MAASTERRIGPSGRQSSGQEVAAWRAAIGSRRRRAIDHDRDAAGVAVHLVTSSTAFRQRIDAIVESFRTMQDDLNGERTVMERYWSKRDTHLQMVVKNLAGMYGDMQAIVALPNIRRLELPAAMAS